MWGVCGKYGLSRSNDAGRDLVDWCEEMGMAHVNSFMRYKRRGTWRCLVTGRWHELDGYLVRGGERQRLVRKVWTRQERELSDHRPVCMRLNVEQRRWRTEVRKERRVLRVRWEGLINEEKRVEYEEKTRQRWESRGEREWGWSEVAEVLVKTVEEVCGRSSKGVASPWMVGRERGIEERIEGITERVRRRNERVGILNVRRKLRAMRGRVVEQLEYEMARNPRIRGEIKETRKELKRFLKGLDREWW